MIISYKKIVFTFFITQLLIIVLLGYFVRQRITQRQLTLQVFLQNQIDVDRKIIAQRALLRETLIQVQSYLLNTNSDIERKIILSAIKENIDKFNKFWAQYRDNYSGERRPFLQQVLGESQELGLVEEESKLLDDIDKKTKAYLSYILSYISTGFGSEGKFLGELTKKQEEIYNSLNQLTDVRYIFGQRIVFAVSGENDKQQGFFTSIFIFLFFISLIVSLLEYLFIHKPVRDIMLFLQDANHGKKGQQLYFSSIVKEIKESEDVINKFIGKAEKHEKER